jgi:AcrR family transcriptional regulator
MAVHFIPLHRVTEATLQRLEQTHAPGSRLPYSKQADHVPAAPRFDTDEKHPHAGSESQMDTSYPLVIACGAMSATPHVEAQSPDTDSPDRPLRSDAQRNRQRLIQAAREVFATRGLGAGLNEIARHAGVGVGTAYRHFADKDALIEAAMRDRLDDLVRIAEEGLANPDAWGGLAHVLREMAAVMVADAGLRDAALNAGRSPEFFEEIDARVAPLITRVFQRAQEAGAVRPDAAVTDLMALLFMVTEFAQQSDAVRPGVHRRYLELFMQALRPSPADAELGLPLSDAELKRILLRGSGP